MKNYWDDEKSADKCNELYKRSMKEAKEVYKIQKKEFDRSLMSALIHNVICVCKFPKFK